MEFNFQTYFVHHFQTTKLQCLLTDVHPDAVMGAVCQTASIHIALNAELCSLDKTNFISRLREIISTEELKLYPNHKFVFRYIFLFRILSELVLDIHNVLLSARN